MKRVWTVVWMMCVIGSMLCVSVGAQSDAITSIEFSNAAAVAEENLSVSGYGDKDSGYATATVGGRLFASVSGTDYRKLEWSKGEYGTEGMQPVMTGGTKNPWGNGAYLEVRVSTKGYENITFCADLGATKKGPRDYKLQYSVDGITFVDVKGATYTVAVNKELATAFDNVALPAQANHCEQLYIRIAVASNMLVNGTAGLIGSTGGETAINHIAVRGEKTATTTASVGTTAVTTVTTAVSDPDTDTDAEAAVTTVTTARQTVTTTAVKSQAVAPHSADTADTSHAMTALCLLTIGGAAVIAARRRLIN